MDTREYITTNQTVNCGRYPFTEGQLRHYLSHRHKNGLNKAVRKIGKRLYLRRDLFENWIESQSCQGGQV